LHHIYHALGTRRKCTTSIGEPYSQRSDRPKVRQGDDARCW